MEEFLKSIGNPHAIEAITFALILLTFLATARL